MAPTLLRLSGDPKLLFDLTPSEHTMGRFGTRVRGKKKVFRCVQALRAQKKRHLPQASGGRSVEAKVATRAPPGVLAGGRTQVFQPDEGKKAFSAHVSGPNCFGNVSRPIRKKKSSLQGPYFFVSLTCFEVTRIHKRS